MRYYLESMRYYLAGVRIEPSKDGGALLVATDGTCMSVFHDPEGAVTEPAIIRIDPPTVRQCLKPIARGKKGRRWFVVTDDEPATGRVIYGITDGAQSVEMELSPHSVRMLGMVGFAEAIDGTYPNWRGVIPAKIKPCAHPVTYSPELLRRFVGIGTSITVWSAGIAEPALVECDRLDFFGVIMSRRKSISLWDDGGSATPPSWTAAP